MKQQKRIQLKPRLSIDKIGKTRFWTGILLGILYAVIFYLFVFYLVEYMMVISIAMGGNLPIIPTEVSFFEKPFLIATSLTVGVTMMIRHWFMQATFHFQSSRKKVSLRLSNYSLFLVYLVFYVASVFIRFSYLDVEFTEANQFINYNSLLFIIPLYIFFAAWTEISRYFKTANWIPYTFFISLLIITFLSFINIKPQGFSKKAFKIIHSEELEYLDSELKKAKEKYNITFSEETLHSLKELRSKRAFDLLKKVRLAFKTDGEVSLDTIILEKILIHNFKGFYIDRGKSYAYIFPLQAYEQLRKVDPKSPKSTELLNIIKEFHDLSLYSLNTFDDRNSILHYNKVSVLSGENASIYRYSRNINYVRMSDQTFFLVYNIQKLNTYDHPFFNRDIPFPPHTLIYDAWIQENFPELKH